MVHARHTCTPFRPWICVASRKESGRHMGVCLHAVMRVCELHIYRSMESSAGGCLQPENCRSRPQQRRVLCRAITGCAHPL